MARNRIQFQKGLSFPEFNALYSAEEQCVAGRLLRSSSGTGEDALASWLSLSAL